MKFKILTLIVIAFLCIGGSCDIQPPEPPVIPPVDPPHTTSTPPIVEPPVIPPVEPPVIPPEPPIVEPPIVIPPEPPIEPPVIIPPIVEPPVIIPPVEPPIIEPPVVEPPLNQEEIDILQFNKGVEDGFLYMSDNTIGMYETLRLELVEKMKEDNLTSAEKQLWTQIIDREIKLSETGTWTLEAEEGQTIDVNSPEFLQMLNNKLEEIIK